MLLINGIIFFTLIAGSDAARVTGKGHEKHKVKMNSVGAQHRLASDLMANYDRTLRPVQNISSVTNITMNPALHSIVCTNEAEESITLLQWFRMIWTDELLRWDPEEYDGIQKLLLPISRIWYPDITILNMIEVNPVLTEDRTYAIIDYDGSVIVSIDQVVTLHCTYEISNFPFDTQNCSFQAGSWMYTSDAVDIYPKLPADLGAYNQHAGWDLISYTTRREAFLYEASEVPFVSVFYDIYMQRKPTYYLTTFVLPSFIITTLSIFGIFSPNSDSGDRNEKVTMGLTTLLTMAVILLIVTDKMPKSSAGMSLLGYYMIMQIVISASAAITAILVMYQQMKWTTKEKVPFWILALTRLQRSNRITSNTNGANAFIGLSQSGDSRMTKLINKDGALQDNKIFLRWSQILTDIRALLGEVASTLHETAADETERQLWQRACRRLDILLMIIFHIMNVTATVCFIMIGYAKLTI
uniref:Uncharacterized protein n=1 Tax=Plectus sambesii TaxID=2011161 RepID=A0A914V2R5_9BILA